MPYTVRNRRSDPAPLSEMNITPLIDVMLVLLIMFIMVIPVATQVLEIPLPSAAGRFAILDSNTVHIDAQDRLYWNGDVLDRQDLLNQLASTAQRSDKPLVRFDPDARASFDRSAKTIALIKDAGIEKFAFVGNDKYRNFGGD